MALVIEGVVDAAVKTEKTPRSSHLDVPAAQREAKIEPGRMLDDEGRGAVSTIAGRGHLPILPAVIVTGDRLA